MNNKRLMYTSYQLQNGKWTPRVKVREYISGDIKEQDFTWNEFFDSKKEADEFAKSKIGQADNSEVSGVTP
jgi:hypothetical protein